ncbi:hypothetical protein [Terribacillus aidingensis]
MEEKKITVFNFKIETQYWLSNEEEDLCSHGEIHLEVDGTVITQAGRGEEWGISESALALLRTLNADYISHPECEEGLILHGCGAMLMSGCPISSTGQFSTEAARYFCQISLNLQALV